MLLQDRGSRQTWSEERTARREEARGRGSEGASICSHAPSLPPLPYALCTMFLALLTWTTLLVSAADANVPPAPSGEDPHVFYLLAGERMLRSGDLTGGREAFEKLLELDSQDAQAHYFLGLIEYEEGNIEKAKTRFRIAHECLGRSLGTSQLQVDADVLPAPPDTKHVQLEFPDGNRARVYYRDGWYVRSKPQSRKAGKPESRREAHGPISQSVYEPMDLLTLEAGSAYRIELEQGRKESWARRGIIGLIVAISFLLAR